MRVLHIVAPGAIGGLERVVQLLALGQAQHGDAVHVALVQQPGSGDSALATSLRPPPAPAAASAVAIHPIAVRGRAYLRERAATLELVRQLEPDVVHTHGYRPDVVDAPAIRGDHVPTVTTVHGFVGGSWKNRLFEHLQRRSYRSFAAVIVVSRALRAQLILEGVPAGRIHVVLNAWQETARPLDRAAARRELDVAGDAFRIGWVGRLSAEKGPDVLIDALAQLNDLPLQVSMIGTGAEQESLFARAARRGVAHRIRWHGIVPDAARVYRAFDAFVLSSRTEGTPIALFEAMAAGVPIVAARVGGVPDVVSPAEAALVGSEDPAALAAAIRAVYSDSARARARAAVAREHLRAHFAVPPWVRRYHTIYQVVTGRAWAAVTA